MDVDLRVVLGRMQATGVVTLPERLAQLIHAPADTWTASDRAAVLASFASALTTTAGLLSHCHQTLNIIAHTAITLSTHPQTTNKMRPRRCCACC